MARASPRTSSCSTRSGQAFTCVDGAGATIEGHRRRGRRDPRRAAHGGRRGDRRARARQRGAGPRASRWRGARLTRARSRCTACRASRSATSRRTERASSAATLTVSESASETETPPSPLRSAPDVALAMIDVTTEAPPPPPPLRTARRGAARVPGCKRSSVRSRTRAGGSARRAAHGVGGTLGVMVATARLGEPNARLRFLAAASAGLSTSTCASARPCRSTPSAAARSADRGSRDLFRDDRLAPALGARHGFGLVLELGVDADGGRARADRARFQPALDLGAHRRDRRAPHAAGGHLRRGGAELDALRERVRRGRAARRSAHARHRGHDDDRSRGRS